MKVVILAGGLGTRLSEETTLRPKPMVEIGGKPILWHIMKIYARHGFNDFVVCLGYKGYVIKEYFANYFLHMSDVTFDLASNKLEEIRAWSRSVHEPVGSLAFSDWTYWNDKTGNDPDYPEIQWKVEVTDRTLYSPCELFESIKPVAGMISSTPNSEASSPVSAAISTILALMAASIASLFNDIRVSLISFYWVQPVFSV